MPQFYSAHFKESDPRYTYAQFINALMLRDFEEALKYCQPGWAYKERKPVEKLKQLWQDHHIGKCIFIKKVNPKTMKKKDLNPDCVCDLIVLLVIEKGRYYWHDTPVFKKQKYMPRLIKETEGRPDKNGSWGVNPIAALKEVK